LATFEQNFKQEKVYILRELILACRFIAIKLEDRDIARNSLFLDTIASPVQRSDILREELDVLPSVNWKSLEHWHMVAKDCS